MNLSIFGFSIKSLENKNMSNSRKQALFRFCIIAAVIACSGCNKSSQIIDSTHSVPVSRETSNYVLRVGLFPYIPAEKGLASWIESDFKRKTGFNVEVSLDRGLFEPYPPKPARSIEHLSSYLLTKGAERRFDIIEIDAIFLGELQETGAIVPFSVPRTDWHPAAQQAVTIESITYGVPHWMCGYFIISSEPMVHDATSASELNTALNSSIAGKADLTGSAVGSYDTLFLYLDAVIDKDKGAQLSSALDRLEPEVLKNLRVVMQNCVETGENLCEEVSEPPARPKEFASGGADAFLGYSERMHAILSGYAGQELSISASPLGPDKRATLFTDALVLSRECIGDCAVVAAAFAEYLVNDETFAALLMSRDTDLTAVPRYLLPSTAGAFDAVKGDPIYRQLMKAVKNANAFPNVGVPEHVRSGAARKTIEDYLYAPAK